MRFYPPEDAELPNKLTPIWQSKKSGAVEVTTGRQTRIPNTITLRNEMKKKLSEILSESGKLDVMTKAFAAAKANGDNRLLPRGKYTADIVAGEAVQSRARSTPGYRLTFEVVEGDHSGARFWHTIWTTEKSMWKSGPELAKLGIENLKQLDNPLPAIFRCSVNLALREDDDGKEWNDVVRFKVLEAINLVPDPFAPLFLTAASDGDSGDHSKGDEVVKNAAGHGESAKESRALDSSPTERQTHLRSSPQKRLVRRRVKGQSRGDGGNGK